MTSGTPSETSGVIETPFWQRLSTRLGVLIVLVVMVLAGATVILVGRGFNRVNISTFQQLQASGIEPTAELSDIVTSTVVNLIAVFLLTLIAATVFSRTLLTEPITSLVKATQEVASGNLGVTLPVTSQSELGLLASSFNTMSTSLAVRTQELVEANAALRQSESRLEQRVSERTAELQALLELSNATALTLEDLPLLAQILDRLNEIAPYRAAVLYKRLGQSSLEEVLARGELSRPSQREMTAVLAGKTHTRSESDALTQLLFPLIVRERAVGVLALEHTAEALDDDKLRLIAAFANQAGVTLENISLYERVQEQAAFEERQHLARELHDSVSQALYSIVLGSYAAKKQLTSDPAQAGQALEYVQNLAEAGLAGMRALIFELRPEVLEQEGLAAALRKQTEALEVRHKIKADFITEGDARAFTLPFTTKQALYRISQEALHNVVKHAAATTVRVTLHYTEDQACLVVSDDGVGFAAAQEYPGHLGLKSMRERALSLGGTFEVTSGKDGTTLVARVPKHGETS